jgi:hypothetical protein
MIVVDQAEAPFYFSCFKRQQLRCVDAEEEAALLSLSCKLVVLGIAFQEQPYYRDV